MQVKLGGTKYSVPIAFLVLTFFFISSFTAVAQWQGANNIPDKVKTAPKPNGNTSDNSNTLTVKKVANDATTATFTVVNRETHKLNANQAKAYTVGSYLYTAGVYQGASLSASTAIDELSTFINHVDGHPGSGRVYKILAAPVDNPDASDTSVIVMSGVFLTTRVVAAGGGTLDSMSNGSTTFYPAQKFGGDMGCMGCHSMATDPTQHNLQQIAGEPPNNDYQACVDASAGGTVEVSPKAVCGPLDANGYLLTGHKNMLRKVLPPSATPYGAYPWAPTNGMFGPENGATLSSANGTNTIDWTTGLIYFSNGDPAKPLYYTFGWVDPPDILYPGGGSTSNYSCARCHTTGFRPDGLAPEPTTTSVVAGVNTYTDIPDDATHLRRTPAGWATGSATSSWQLTGIQCERCHNNSHLRDCDDASVTGFTRPTIAGQTVTNCQVVADENGVWHYAKPYQPVDVQATELCIECHRQERSNTTGTYAPTHTLQPAQLPGKNLPDWPAMASVGGKGAYGGLGAVTDGGGCSDSSYTTYSGCIAAGKTWNFKPSMSHGGNGAQAFLASPHGRYNGTLAMASQNSPDLFVVMNGFFDSHFKGEEVRQGLGESWGLGEANNNNGGCTACHNPHYSTVATTTPAPTPMTRECADCHGRTDQMLASTMKHPTGPGTPFPDGIQARGNSETCVVCHMVAASGAPSYHYFEINADANYYTFGPASVWYTDHDTKTTTLGGISNVAYTGQPNTFDLARTDPTTGQPYTYKAVAVDVDLACGQCHGGGNSSPNTGWNNPYGLTPPNSGVTPVAFSRTYLAMAASGIHNTDYRTPTAAVPTFSVPAGTYATTQSVYLSDTTIGANIYYTTDGTTPTTASALYTPGVPVTVATTTTLQAIAGGPGFTSSAVASATYNIVALPATPTFNPAAGIYYGTQSVSVTTSTPNAGTTFYYTTDGTTPTTSSTSCAAPCTVSVASSKTLKAIAVYTNADGSQTSGVASAIYRILATPAPTFSPTPFPTIYSATTNVTLSDTVPGVTICYTTNLTTPVGGDSKVVPSGPAGRDGVRVSPGPIRGLPPSNKGKPPVVGAVAGTCTVGTPYTGTIPLARNTTTTINAVAGGPGFTPSKVVSATYVIR